ncbi:MAG: hypothetical protein RMH75_02710 [Archaeoglobaceae archaeon]|nr:hypothetical protein [Archaeoglobaceae archaeon]MDW7989565.1 hypothetical protein [Archaeoglobaceae archaeon]
MWLKIASSSDKEEVLEIASRLRKIGARVEVKEWIEWDLDEIFAIRGRMSELKSRGIDLSEWEKRIEIIKDLLKEDISKEKFETEFIRRIFLDLRSDESVENSHDLFEKLTNKRLIMREIENFLTINKIKLGETSEIPDDPELIIETEEAGENTREIIKVSFYPVTEIYVDVLSIMGVDFKKVSVDFEEIVLAAILEIIGEILSEIEKKGLGDLDNLLEFSSGVIMSKSWDFVIDCSEIFENIIRSLEKSGILRVSGKKVKLRRD